MSSQTTGIAYRNRAPTVSWASAAVRQDPALGVQGTKEDHDAEAVKRWGKAHRKLWWVVDRLVGDLDHEFAERCRREGLTAARRRKQRQ